MSTLPGPVVVAIDGSTDAATVAVALDVAAREAMLRRVDLRLVYGRGCLPPWPAAWHVLAGALARTGDAHPSLVVSVAIYPGTAADAIHAAIDTAGLVILAVPADGVDPESAAVVSLTPDELHAVATMIPATLSASAR